MHVTDALENVGQGRNLQKMFIFHMQIILKNLPVSNLTDGNR